MGSGAHTQKVRWHEFRSLAGVLKTLIDPSSLSFLRAELLATASTLIPEFRETAVIRDREGGTPKRERDRLRQSGLLTASIPTEYGGLGARWSEVLDLVRLFARVDSSLAHVFGFQHLMLATARLFGTKPQWSALYRQTVQNRWFWGNALNPLDRTTTIAASGDGFVVNGVKSFSSGSVDSDRLVISALAAETGKLVVASVPTDRRGIHVGADWDNIGQRQTDSGSVRFENVWVEADEIFERPGPLGSVFASLRPLLAQLILCNVYLGLAEGAFTEARSYVASQGRPWASSGVSAASEDPYVLRHYGEFWVALEAAQGLVDAAALAFDVAFDKSEALSDQERGLVSVRIATAKVATTRTALEITARIFEVAGARATTAQLGLDRFWRNARTHTLHDPVDYKLREIGEYALAQRLPTPSFYS